MKPATDLINDKPTPVIELPTMANEKVSTHSTWAVFPVLNAAIHWNYCPGCALALKGLTTSFS